MNSKWKPFVWAFSTLGGIATLILGSVIILAIIGATAYYSWCYGFDFGAHTTAKGTMTFLRTVAKQDRLVVKEGDLYIRGDDGSLVRFKCPMEEGR